MKKLILLLTVFFTYLGVKAQETTTDYIYSGDGFEVKTGLITVTYSSDVAVYKSIGLYTKDGKTLVAAMGSYVKWNTASYFDYDPTFYVLDGTEVIGSKAFQSKSGCTVYIPSSVRYIAPDAIVSETRFSGSNKTNSFGGIQDGCKEEKGAGAVNAPAADHNATEVARYNVQGIRLNDPQNGINIIQMSDGTAKKELVTE